MGAIRGVLLVIVSVVFLISLFAMNSLFVISSSLEYENIQKELVPIVKQTLNDEIGFDSLIENTELVKMQNYCKNNSNNLPNYSFEQEGYNFTISCDTISNGTDSIISYGIDTLVYETYYQTYDCSFWSCFDMQSLPLFIVSKQSRDYFNGLFYYALLACLVLLVLIFLLVEKKTNLFLLSGVIVIISSLPFMKLSIFFSSLPGEFLKFLSILFAQAYNVFITMLLIGIGLVIIGIVLKFFGIGFKIEEFFSKFKSKEEKKPEEKKIEQKASAEKPKGKK